MLLGYTSGFQVWDLEQGTPALLVSRREGPVRWAAGAVLIVLEAALYARTASMLCDMAWFRVVPLMQLDQSSH